MRNAPASPRSNMTVQRKEQKSSSLPAAVQNAPGAEAPNGRLSAGPATHAVSAAAQTEGALDEPLVLSWTRGAPAEGSMSISGLLFLTLQGAGRFSVASVPGPGKAPPLCGPGMWDRSPWHVRFRLQLPTGSTILRPPYRRASVIAGGAAPGTAALLAAPAPAAARAPAPTAAVSAGAVAAGARLRPASSLTPFRAASALAWIFYGLAWPGLNFLWSVSAASARAWASVRACVECFVRPFRSRILCIRP